MGSDADVSHELDHVAVASTAHGEPALAHVAGGVAHHGHVHIIEMPQLDQFLFAAQELEFALVPHLKPLFHLNEFFGRNCKRHDRTRELGYHFRG